MTWAASARATERTPPSSLRLTILCGASGAHSPRKKAFSSLILHVFWKQIFSGEPNSDKSLSNHLQDNLKFLWHHGLK